MSMMHVLLGILGILAAVAGICGVSVWLGKRYGSERFDERQKIAKGEAYRVSFWVGFVYYGAVALYFIPQVNYGQPRTEPKIDGYLLVYLGLMLQIWILHIYDLMTDSVLPLGEKPLVIAAADIMNGFLWLRSFESWNERYPGMQMTGEGGAKWIWLVSAVTSFLLAAVYLLSMLRRNREEE